MDDAAEDWEEMDTKEAEAEVIKEEPEGPEELKAKDQQATQDDDKKGEAEDERASTPQITLPPAEEDTSLDIDPSEMTMNVTVIGTADSPTNLTPTTTEPVPIPNAASGSGRASTPRDGKTPSPPPNGTEGPITPRNEDGPWVFDGSGQRVSEETPGMGSLDAAADMLNGATINSPNR